MITHCMSISECYLKHFKRVGGAPCSFSVRFKCSHSSVNIITFNNLSSEKNCHTFPSHPIAKRFPENINIGRET